MSNSDLNFSLGSRLEKFLKEKGMSRYRLSAISSVPQSTISDLVKGKNKNPSSELLGKISAALNISVDELLNGNQSVENIDTEIPNNLKAIRESKNISGTKIAEMLNISPQYYYDLEKGERRLNDTIILQLANYYNVSTDYLLGRTDELPVLSKMSEYMDRSSFGKYLRELRELRNLTMGQVETYTGISKSYISLLEIGKRDIPSPDILKKFATFYKVDYLDMMVKVGYLDVSHHVDRGDIPNYDEIIPLQSLPFDSEISPWLDDPRSKDYIEFAYKVYTNGISKEQLKKANITFILD